MQSAAVTPSASDSLRGSHRRVGRSRAVVVAAQGRIADQAQAPPGSRRRDLLLATVPASSLLLSLISGPAQADDGWAGVLAARKVFRPDELSPTQAVVVLLDAKSVLREIAALAKTPQDSEERFRARALWPGYAKRLRDAGPATPVVARIVAGASDKEETISALYGGKADTPGLTDELYLAFGRVLTISGRTIRPEAQADPEPSQSAQKAVENLLAQVPKSVLEEAQDFRVKRAAAAAARAAA